MKLSRKTEIAIDLLVCCATRPNEFIKVRGAAVFANATPLHIYQISNLLVRSGVLASERGKTEESASHAADKITVGDIIRLTQPELSLRKVPYHNATLGILMEKTAQTAFLIWDACTIADLVSGAPGVFHSQAWFVCDDDGQLDLSQQ